MKRIFRTIIALVMAISLFTSNIALADDIKVTLNGTQIQFDQPPIIKNDRTLVPVRAIFEAMGMSVSWNPETQRIMAVGDSIIIIMQIGSVGIAYGSSEDSTGITMSDVAPCIENDRTLVPVRVIAETTGYTVNWNADTRTVEITGEQRPAPSTVEEEETTSYDLKGTDYELKGTMSYYSGTENCIDFGAFDDSRCNYDNGDISDPWYGKYFEYTTNIESAVNYVHALNSIGFTLNENTSRYDGDEYSFSLSKKNSAGKTEYVTIKSYKTLDGNCRVTINAY